MKKTRKRVACNVLTVASLAGILVMSGCQGKETKQEGSSKTGKGIEFTKDFDQDGKTETFLLRGENDTSVIENGFTGDLVFVSADGKETVLLENKTFMVSQDDPEEGTNIANTTTEDIFGATTYYGEYALVNYYSVVNGEVKDCLAGSDIPKKIEGVMLEEGDDYWFLVTENDMEYNISSKTYGSSVFKEYPFYYDSTDHAFKAYRAKELSNEEVGALNGGDEILSAVSLDDSMYIQYLEIKNEVIINLAVIEEDQIVCAYASYELDEESGAYTYFYTEDGCYAPVMEKGEVNTFLKDLISGLQE